MDGTDESGRNSSCFSGYTNNSSVTPPLGSSSTPHDYQMDGTDERGRNSSCSSGYTNNSSVTPPLGSSSTPHDYQMDGTDERGRNSSCSSGYTNNSSVTPPLGSSSTPHDYQMDETPFLMLSKRADDSSGQARIPKDAINAMKSAYIDMKEDGDVPTNLVTPRKDVVANVIAAICRRDLSGGSKNKKWPYNTRTTLRGMGGLGKSTVAAMVVGSIEIRAAFEHILWINLGHYFVERSDKNNLTYEMYLDCLINICDQLRVPSDWLNCHLVWRPGDSETILAMKNSKFSPFVKEFIISLNLLSSLLMNFSSGY